MYVVVMASTKGAWPSRKKPWITTKASSSRDDDREERHDTPIPN